MALVRSTHASRARSTPQHLAPGVHRGLVTTGDSFALQTPSYVDALVQVGPLAAAGQDLRRLGSGPAASLDGAPDCWPNDSLARRMTSTRYGSFRRSDSPDNLHRAYARVPPPCSRSKVGPDCYGAVERDGQRRSKARIRQRGQVFKPEDGSHRSTSLIPPHEETWHQPASAVAFHASAWSCPTQAHGMPRRATHVARGPAAWQPGARKWPASLTQGELLRSSAPQLAAAQ